MFESSKSYLKITLFMILFFAPLFVVAWNQHLDAWLASNHTLEPLPPVQTPEKLTSISCSE